MKLKIKNGFLKNIIFCPINKRNIYVESIDASLYPYYYKNGYREFFEEDNHSVIFIDMDKPKVIKKHKPTDDLPS